ncbi:hypothetical protein HAX54_004157 [Datura stramonium]|uniref:Uncharacterized protein n=1 Tax=Datura stramonium TaxID=4076 RepID=A0ABS8WSS1_DATST|nr:hypothetical protein [Datura stramonium]
MTLTHAIAANRSNTSTFDAASGGNPTVNPTATAANSEIEAAHAWFEVGEREHSTTTLAPMRDKLEKAFIDRFLFEEARFALAMKFEQLE